VAWFGIQSKEAFPQNLSLRQWMILWKKILPVPKIQLQSNPPKTLSNNQTKHQASIPFKGSASSILHSQAFPILATPLQQILAKAMIPQTD